MNVDLPIESWHREQLKIHCVLSGATRFHIDNPGKQWWDEKKEKELSFFEAKKEKELAFFEDKLSKKLGKKSKSRKTTAKPCYGYATSKYYSEEVTEAEEPESEEVTEKSYRKSYAPKSYDRPTYSVPTIYDVRDDSAEGARYFT